MDIRIESIHFVADQKLKERIEKKVEKLSQFFDRIINATIHLKLENSGQVRDKIIEIKLRVPGDTLFASAKHKQFESATDSALSTLKRNLVKYKETRFSKAGR